MRICPRAPGDALERAERARARQVGRSGYIVIEIASGRARIHRALSYIRGMHAMARDELRHKEFKLLAIGPRNLFRGNYGITMVDKRIKFISGSLVIRYYVC